MPEIKINRIKTTEITVPIRGLSPLIMHKWSEKAKKQIRDKKLGIKTKERSKLDAEQECADATYHLDDGSPGFPAVGFKAAIRSAAHKDLGIPRTLVEKGLFIIADGQELVRITCAAPPKMREDTVRVGMGGTDLRYRPEFHDWSSLLRIVIDTEVLTVDAVVNLIERAGFGIGIGEWRPERGGDFGRFTVERTEVVEK